MESTDWTTRRAVEREARKVFGGKEVQKNPQIGGSDNMHHCNRAAELSHSIKRSSRDSDRSSYWCMG